MTDRPGIVTGQGRQHGTHACYVWGPAPGAGKGCRCNECRTAHSDYEKTRARRTAPPYVDATEARAHVRDLMAHGVGLKTITKRAGLSHGAMSKLIYGDQTRGMAPTKRIRPATRDAILSVKRTDQADGARVPAGPTWKVIEHLLAEGWTKAAIARAIGQTTGGLQLSRDEVTAGNARAIAALLDEPVPSRRSRHGLHPVPQASLAYAQVEGRENARRAAEAEQRADYRRKAAKRAAEEAGTTDPYELPDLYGAAGSWMTSGPCRRPNVPSWLFFPAPGDQETIEAAKAICATCPVAAQCAAAGRGEEGIWGGLTAEERQTAAVAS